MKIGIAGSRSIDADIPEGCIPDGVTEILSGGARGIDRAARRYAYEHNILITEILPEYNLYGRRAPLIRNDLIISLSDKVYIFWDGKSKGSDYVIKKCKECSKPYEVYLYTCGTFQLLVPNPADERH